VTRISTYASQQIAQHQMLRTREETDRLLQQTSSARRAASFSELGVDTGRALNAHALLDQLDGQDWVNKSVQTQLELYNNRMGEIDDTMEGLRQELWKAVSTNNALSLTQQIKNAFETFRTSLNAQDDGRKLFAGANSEGDAFKPKTLDDLAALPDTDLEKAYGNDQVRRSGRVGDGINFEFGILASDLGTDFLQAFKSLQSLGNLPDKMDDDQIAAVEKAAATIGIGLDQLRKINAQNGVRQNRVEAIETRITDRTRIITGVVGGLEDADLPQVQTALLAHRELLEISFKSYRDWTGLSLAAFLR
jgi:flagellar hook-associated protein 3 FlgL